MAYTVDIGRRAQIRFRRSLDYIAIELASPQAMNSLAVAFDDAVEAIKTFPSAYPSRASRVPQHPSRPPCAHLLLT